MDIDLAALPALPAVFQFGDNRPCRLTVVFGSLDAAPTASM
jgi:hypothetical protein